MKVRDLTGRLKAYLLELTRGVATIGVAPVERFEGAPKGHAPRDFVPNAESVIVIALPIVSGLMGWNGFLESSDIIRPEETYRDAKGSEKTWSPRTTIRKHVERRCSYEVINDELQAASMYGAMFLEEAGYASVYLPTTYGQTLSWPGNYQWDFPKPPRGFAPFSHRHAAVAAGLGELGLNNLLLTPRNGPRQRLVSIITAAALTPDPLRTKTLCLGESCARCVAGCPARAFGAAYELSIGGRVCRLAKIDIEACRGYYKDSVYGEQCGRQCMTACPLGKLKKSAARDGGEM